jgi:ABC-type amino acid transport substrate-binding protein
MTRLTLLTLLLAIAVWPPPAAGGALPGLKEAGALRICADPDNLPFSSQDPQQPGFELELAREIARELALRPEVVWIPTQGGRAALRQLLEGRCDVFPGLPSDRRFLADHPRLALSVPYYTMGHVLVLPEGSAIRDLRELAGKPVAVEFSSLAAIFAFGQGYALHTHLKQAELFGAVARGEAAAAIMWAPIAGWMLKTHPAARLRFVQLHGADLQFDMAVGMRQADEALKTAVDGAILRLAARGAIAQILQRYGVPTPSRPASDQPTKAEAKVGEALYKKSCSECHGADAKGSLVAADLTVFKGTDDTFVRTVLNGRPGTPMPPFKGALSEEEVRQILAYIKGLPK